MTTRDSRWFWECRRCGRHCAWHTTCERCIETEQAGAIQLDGASETLVASAERTIVAYTLVDGQTGQVLRTVPVTDEGERRGIRSRLYSAAEKRNQAYGAHRWTVGLVFS